MTDFPAERPGYCFLCNANAGAQKAKLQAVGTEVSASLCLLSAVRSISLHCTTLSVLLHGLPAVPTC